MFTRKTVAEINAYETNLDICVKIIDTLLMLIGSLLRCGAYFSVIYYVFWIAA